jgi:NodT family efflux transporter outer membrane factor (OMF) lipoprotein
MNNNPTMPKDPPSNRSVFLPVALAVLLGGCAVGPNFTTPAAPDAPRYTDTPMPDATVTAATSVGGAQQHFLPGKELPAQWWTLFQSEPLDKVIRQALADSPNLASAQAALRQARENYIGQTGALLYPSVDGNLSGTREKVSGASQGLPGGGTSIFNLYNASVNVSYALDIFGGNRRTLEGLAAQVDYEGYELEGAYLSLTSNVVTAAVREASLRSQIQATHEIIAAEEKQLGLTEKQYHLGGASRLSTLTLRSQLEQSRATLPPLESQLAQTRNQLAALTGRLPSEAVLPEFKLTEMTLPQDLPLSVASELVRHRPDIRASEALLHQASAQIGVATADMYPKITLTGSFGSASLKARDTFGGPSIWSIAAGLVQPIFHGGELEANRRAAIAAYDQAQAQYRETVLTAFQNVADSLRALEADARTLQAQAAAEDAARQQLDLTEKQYRLGGTSSLALLIAQQQYQQARVSLSTAQAARYSDTAALFQALGGGWWQDTATPTPLAASTDRPTN